MNEIALDIKDITYSREMYESKPKPFASAYIYILLGIILVSIGFMSWFKIDIVTKAGGIVRPNQQVASVKSGTAGVINELYYNPNSYVYEGDILYTLKTDDLQLQEVQVNQRIAEITLELEGVAQYKSSMEQGVNLLDVQTHSYYYYLYEQFVLNYQLKAHDLAYSEDVVATHLSNNGVQIEKIEEDQAQLEILLRSVEDTSNYFQDPLAQANFYAKYINYESSMVSIQQQYNTQIEEIRLGTSTTLTLKNINELNEELSGYVLLKDSIEGEKSYFYKVNAKNLEVYSKMYDGYVLKVEELTTVYEAQKERYELYLRSDFDLRFNDLDIIENNKEQAYNALEMYKIDYLIDIAKNISNLQMAIAEHENAYEEEQTKAVIIQNLEKDRDLALSQLKSERILNIEDEIARNEETILNLELNNNQLAVETEKGLYNESTGTYTLLSLFQVQEIVTSLEAIKQLETELESLEQRLDTIQQEIKESVITAQTEGQVHVITDIIKGDSIFIGEHIMNIVPVQQGQYKILIYLDNKDISKVAVGDQVKFHFDALSYREYGHLTGEIISLRTDADFDERGNNSYYLVEALLNDTKIANYKGDIGEIVSGMTCEAQVITDEKTLLRFVLEKIDLLD